MIVVRMMGGLGNQFFQYAAARALAIERGAGLILDTRYYDRHGDRTYGLHRFDIRAELATAQQLAELDATFARWHRGPRRVLRGVMRRLGVAVGPRVMIDQERGYDPRLRTAPEPVVMEGYWQSELYFARIADLIRDELSFREAPDERNAQVLEEIAAGTSVSLHVRRGDYLTTAAPMHGTCDLDYYRHAVDLVTARVPSPKFFVFSDDPDWTRRNIDTGHETVFVTHNTGTNDHEDLRLMAACRHFIVANSSFSWWGAWLSRSAAKTVVAPRKWFAGRSSDDFPIVPASWHRL